jgi:hypothetical protein
MTKPICILLILTSLAYAKTQDWLTFKGAWFNIDYPPNFTVKPSMTSSSASGYDSAFFVSPDGLVTFYVYSPQWSGEPKDIEQSKQTEKVISKSTKEGVDRLVREVTIRARNGSYTRSFVDTKGENTRLVFGIKYANKKAYKKYLSDYKRFKKSLQQFAD